MYYTKKWMIVRILASGIELKPGSIIPFVRNHYEVDPVREAVTRTELEEAKATLARLTERGEWNEDWTIKI